MSDKKNTPKTLFDLGMKYGTDKITHHRYDRYFEQFFKPFQNENIKLFEIGIDNKSSLALWLAYFPNAMIYGLDIGLAFEEDRAKIFKGDQSDPDALKKVLAETGRCHIIIDDGSHVPEHQLACFSFLFDEGLEYGGLYIIEDIETSYWKNVSLYGYDISYGLQHPLNIVEIFKPLLHHINREFLLDHEVENVKKQSKVEHKALRQISSITFARNCVILKKMDKHELQEAGRSYRFRQAIEGS